MQYRHTQFDETVNVTASHPLKDFAIYALMVFALIGAIYYVSIYAIELLIPHIDQKTEKRIWSALFNESFIPDEKRDDKIIASEKYLQQLLDKIPKKELIGNDYKIILVQDDEANAMALPSGKIILYTGLFNKLKTENGVVFVLGHELGHFAHRDHLRGMGRSLITSLLLMPLISDSNGSSLLASMGTGFNMHFSREQESAADEYGLYALNAVYGHAGGATEFFDYLQKHEKEPWIFKFSSTHPVSEDRILHLKHLIEEKGMKTDAAVGMTPEHEAR